MSFRKLTTAAVLVAAVTIVGTSNGYAEPSPKPGGSGFTVKQVDKTVVATVDKGSFEASSNAESIALKDASGKTIESWPLTYTLDGYRYPIQREISSDKRTVKLTPVTDRSKATPGAPKPKADKPKAAGKAIAAESQTAVRLKPVASDSENALAQASFMNQLGIATSVGTIVGTIVGAIVGGVVGAAVALASCVALLACLLVGAPIFITFATVGGIAGTVIAGGGALVGAGWDYLQTLQAAPGTSHYQADIDKQYAQNRPR